MDIKRRWPFGCSIFVVLLAWSIGASAQQKAPHPLDLKCADGSPFDAATGDCTTGPTPAAATTRPKNSTVWVRPDHACKTGEPEDEVAGACSDPETRASVKTQNADLRWFGVGVNVSPQVLLSGWRAGGDLAVSGGLSILLRSWLYDGFHRVTAFQVDANVGYAVLDRQPIWVVSGGPAYHPTDNRYIAPVFKLQLFLSGTQKAFRPTTPLQSAGLALSISWDITTVRRSEANDTRVFVY
jgi:hypothetical protein